MAARDSQLVTEALFSLDDVKEAIEGNRREEALNALRDAVDALASAKHAPGFSVAATSRRLGVSEPTVRVWVKRGVLSAVPEAKPMQIEPKSLGLASRAIAELRERGKDSRWLQALADYMDDREARGSNALREGLKQLENGELEPA